MQECINLTPSNGASYDVRSIRAKFLEHPDVIETAGTADTLQVVFGPDAQAYARRRREASERNSLSGGVIVVEPELIHFAITEAFDEELLVMRELAQWVVDNHPSRIGGMIADDDWTDRCAGRVDPMFEPELPAPQV